MFYMKKNFWNPLLECFSVAASSGCHSIINPKFVFSVHYLRLGQVEVVERDKWSAVETEFCIIKYQFTQHFVSIQDIINIIALQSLVSFYLKIKQKVVTITILIKEGGKIRQVLLTFSDQIQGHPVFSWYWPHSCCHPD